ncbi:conjugative transfer protein MobI(A/C) [Vibrio coralliilyticus]|uniref:Uncharacterized protein n=1 Tax=Vibrio coralliilyticus TaxID=190893 RepID=A0AAP6ZNJ5_9VIBR|nr:conjugative transfer protein MobI(A/C) [Vibrio coralliilyticus]NOI32003.1 hypothetical protein [Vibrio coralliilyticus]NOJ25204.1 hypothetical protein [Vibrio coralliilyticus]
MQSVVEAIYDEIDELYGKADILYSTWMKSVAEREVNRSYTDINNREKTSYELRVEFNGVCFRIRWLEVQFVKRGNKTLRLTKNITCPESGKHKMSQFKKGDEWELRLIEMLEESLSQIRYKLKHLMKAHSSIVWASKPNKQPLVTKEMKDRVERKVRSMKKVKESLQK